MVVQSTKNKNKLDALDLISNEDEFYLLDINELESIYEELISPWSFNESGPTFKEYLKTFPEKYELMHSSVKNAIKKCFDNPNGLINNSTKPSSVLCPSGQIVWRDLYIN